MNDTVDGITNVVQILSVLVVAACICIGIWHHHKHKGKD
jgi:hypothetical protein